MPSQPPSKNLPLVAFLFEASLVPLALLAGWLSGQHPLGSIRLTADQIPEHLRAIALGLVASLPLLLGLVLIDRYPVGPLRQLKELAMETLQPLFRTATIWQLALLSVVAGLGEEMLFRGWLQNWIGRGIGPPLGAVLGLICASLIFAVCHWISHTYLVMVLLAGLYLGLLLILSQSLLAPITAHAVYDFVALLWMKMHDRA
jgi:membrane protease YdiL (CAAX protease family)